MDASTLRCQGLGPQASPACSCGSAGSPGREAPFRLRLSSEMRNMLRRKWCLLAVALGTNGTGWKGENGLRCLAGPGLQGVPSWGGWPCVVGGPSPGWPSSPVCRAPSVVGGRGAPGRHRNRGNGAVGGHPTLRACVVFVGVHRSAAPPAKAGPSTAGRRPEGGDPAAHPPGTRRSPCSLAS